MQDPLTYRFPRTLAELDNDKHAWWADSRIEHAREQALREELDNETNLRRMRRINWLLAIAMFAALLVALTLLAPLAPDDTPAPSTTHTKVKTT